MNTVQALRQRGFRYRRISFGLKALSLLWATSMIGVYVTGISWLSFFIAVTGMFAWCAPALILSAAFDEVAERQFARAAATREQSTLLGVVYPTSRS